MPATNSPAAIDTANDPKNKYLFISSCSFPLSVLLPCLSAGRCPPAGSYLLPGPLLLINDRRYQLQFDFIITFMQGAQPDLVIPFLLGTHPHLVIPFLQGARPDPRPGICREQRLTIPDILQL